MSAKSDELKSTGDAGLDSPLDETPASVSLRAVVLVAWLSIAGALWWWASTNDLTPVALVAEAIEILRDRPQISALAYVAAYALRPFFLFSAAVLTLAGGFLFGPIAGFFLTVLAANLSAGVAYSIGRAFGPKVLGQERADGLVSRWAWRMRVNSFETVLIMRFLLVPYDAVSYLAGFLRMRFRAFIAATALGSLTGTAQFVLLGASLERFTFAEPSIDLRVLGASFVFMAIGLGLSRVVQRRERARIAEIAAVPDADG